MSRTLTLRSIDIPTVHKFGIGFDSMLNGLLQSMEDAQHASSYPPYNIVKYGENDFTIELAVAGFKEGQLSIEVTNNQLLIVGNQGNKSTSDSAAAPCYVFNGISARSFVRAFTLAQNVTVIGASTIDGILSVQLHREAPVETEPKKIAITRQV